MLKVLFLWGIGVLLSILVSLIILGVWSVLSPQRPKQKVLPKR